jgi:hypothetical protein
MTEREKRIKLQKEALDKFKKLYNGPSDRGHVQEEMPRVSKSTLKALVTKGVLQKAKGVFDEDGPDYYYWTGKELE